MIASPMSDVQSPMSRVRCPESDVGRSRPSGLQPGTHNPQPEKLSGLQTSRIQYHASRFTHILDNLSILFLKCMGSTANSIETFEKRSLSPPASAGRCVHPAMAGLEILNVFLRLIPLKREAFFKGLSIRIRWVT